MPRAMQEPILRQSSLSRLRWRAILAAR